MVESNGSKLQTDRQKDRDTLTEVVNMTVTRLGTYFHTFQAVCTIKPWCGSNLKLINDTVRSIKNNEKENKRGPSAGFGG